MKSLNRSFASTVLIGIVSASALFAGGNASAAPSPQPPPPGVSTPAIAPAPLPPTAEVPPAVVERTIETAPAPAPTGDARVAAASRCPEATRFLACSDSVVTIRQVTNGVQTGSYQIPMLITQRMGWNTNTINEQIDTGPVANIGVVDPAIVLTLQFDGAGTTSVGLAPGSSASDNFSWLPPLQNTVGASTTQSIRAVTTGAALTNLSALTRVRCDGVAYGSTVGCVNPDVTPQMTQMLGLPNIIANIRNQIANGKPQTLRRLADTAAQAANRAIACKTSVTGTAPTGTSCDEYPFASSYEGGAGAGFAFVPTTEQGSQSGLITNFYRAQRVLDGENFFVVT